MACRQSQRTVGILVLVLCSLASTVEISGIALRYPNPQLDTTQCGRANKSWICDPNAIISDEEADQLDALITAVTEATHAPCSSEGYYIGIALVDSIPLAEELSTPMAGGTNDDLATERRDSENKKAIEFVKEIQEKWSLGKCNEVVIILFSQRNIQPIAMAGKSSSAKLTKDILYDISLKSMQFFGTDQKVYMGLKTMINHMWSVFNGTYVMPQYGRPETAAISSASQRLHHYQPLPVFISLMCVKFMFYI